MLSGPPDSCNILLLNVRYVSSERIIPMQGSGECIRLKLSSSKSDRYFSIETNKEAGHTQNLESSRSEPSGQPQNRRHQRKRDGIIPSRFIVSLRAKALRRNGYSVSDCPKEWITTPERSFGSNHVVLGGMIFPVSAMSISCFIETG